MELGGKARCPTLNLISIDSSWGDPDQTSIAKLRELLHNGTFINQATFGAVTMLLRCFFEQADRSRRVFIRADTRKG
jgi:hypothetical protein